MKLNDWLMATTFMVVGCGDPAAATVEPTPTAGTKAPAQSAPATSSSTPATTGTTKPPPAATSTTPTTPSTAAAGAKATAPATGGAPAPATGTGAAGQAAAAGSGAAAGSSAATSGAAGAAAGSDAPAMETLPPCPSGWTCQDPAKPLADMGIADGKVTDAMGNPVPYACGNGGAVDCDPANPAGSCKELSKPFCAHVAISSLGVDLYSCAQVCKP